MQTQEMKRKAVSTKSYKASVIKKTLDKLNRQNKKAKGSQDLLRKACMCQCSCMGACGY